MSAWVSNNLSPKWTVIDRAGGCTKCGMPAHSPEGASKLSTLDSTMMSCVFCAIIDGTAPAIVVRRWPYALAIVPLGPVTDGHLLVIPTVHVRDATENPAISALAMRAASELAQPPCNIITSAGAEATQTVWHLHLHVVPRRPGDRLALPWSP